MGTLTTHLVMPSIDLSGLPAPAAEPDPEPEPPAGEQEMVAVCAQCGIEVTHHQLQDTIREREGEPFRTFAFPRLANEHSFETFSEWLNPYDEPDDAARRCGAQRSWRPRRSSTH